MNGTHRAKDYLLEGRALGSVTLANWQQQRAYGLRNFERVVPDLMAVNAERIRPLTVERDYSIARLPAVRALCAHGGCDGLLVLCGDRILFEEYWNGMTSIQPHSCQSSSKTIMNILAGKAIVDGTLDLEERVEKYVPEIGPGYCGRTVADVLAMNVRHEHDEMAAATGDRTLFDREESTMGFTSSGLTSMSSREFVTSLNAGNNDGTNENRTGAAFYSTANSVLAGWLVERATGIPLHHGVRNAMHAIGGENTVAMAVDRVGIPVVGGGLIMTLRDFSRYGLLLRLGGVSVRGDVVGGGADFVERTLEDGEVTAAIGSSAADGTHYVYGTYTAPWGLGHSGWAGQWLWADPESETVIAAFGGLMGADPTDPAYSDLLVDMTRSVVEHGRCGR